jgi:hypothetical protein
LCDFATPKSYRFDSQMELGPILPLFRNIRMARQCVTKEA